MMNRRIQALARPGLRSVRHRIRSANYLRKWVVLGAAIGFVGGTGAIVFYTALEVATHLFLGVLAGYAPPTPAGEGGVPITDAARQWAIPLVVALGGLISGVLVYRFAPEAEGHGTDAAIAAFHHHPRGIRGRVPLVKVIASAITIGSGDSGAARAPRRRSAPDSGRFSGACSTSMPGTRASRSAVCSAPAYGACSRALFGSVAHAPLAVMLMVAEMTGNLSMLAPAKVGPPDPSRRPAYISGPAAGPQPSRCA